MPTIDKPTNSQVLPGANPAVSLQKAIEIAKKHIQIPENFGNFTSHFSDYNDHPIWALNWRGSGNTNGYLGVEVNARTGDITSMNLYIPDTKQSAVRIPSITLDEATKIADDFLTKIASSHRGELQLISPLKQLQNVNHLNNEYSVHWQRVAEGIPVNGEGAIVGIDKIKGTITSYQLNLKDNDFPSASKAITAEQAEKAFMDAGMLELQYLVPQRFQPLNQSTPPEPILVYSLNHKSNGVIDALTGTPLILSYDQSFSYNAIGAGALKEALMVGDSGQNTVELTPEELAEISKTSQLITQEEACEILYKWMPKGRHMELRSAALQAGYNYPETKLWDLTFTIGSETNSQSYLYGRINAETGELISFSYDFARDPFNPQEAMSRTEAREKAEAFLKKIQPAKVNSLRFNPETEYPLYSEREPQPTYYFSFTRLENRIPVVNQGINVTVDSITGEIVAFGLNWPNIKFPSAQNVLNKDQSAQSFLTQKPLTMCFNDLRSGQAGSEMRLVYLPWVESGSTSSNIIDAHTGKLLDWSGQPLAELAKTQVFEDIQGIPAQREINILGQMGFFREYDNQFLPKQQITLVSFLQALILARDGDTGIYKTNTTEIMENAFRKGWISEQDKPDQILDRANCSRIIIRYLNLEQAAQIPNIYINQFKDLKSGDDLIGTAALLKGLGVVLGKGTTFDPSAPVTREEAAQFVYRMANVNLR